MIVRDACMSYEESEDKRINDIFPGESYTKTIELIERIKRLVPLDKDKVTYLEILISYVDGIINGDDLHQFSTFQLSDLAKKALSEIMNDVHSQILESYRTERMDLQDNIANLSVQRNNLYTQVKSLEDTKSSLVRESNSLSLELEKLKRELQELRVNGFNKVQSEINAEKQRLDFEVESLNTEKNSLNTYIDELKSIIDTYNKTISKFDENDEEIVWENLPEDSPVYSLSVNNIDLFINNLVEEYMQKTGESEYIAKNSFRINCQGLYAISDILKNADGVEIYKTLTIGFIINKNWAYGIDIKIAKMIKEALSTIKLPNYKNKNRNMNNVSKNSIPNNMDTLLRELHFQRFAALALAKQKILESQLQSVIRILHNIAGPDFDFSSLQLNDLELENLLSNNSDSSTKSLS